LAWIIPPIDWLLTRSAQIIPEPFSFDALLPEDNNMMQSRGLKTLILATTLVPSLLIAVVLGTYLSTSRQHDLELLLRERAQACATQLANVARRDLLAQDKAALQELALLALEERGVESIDIFNAHAQRLAHAGPQRESAVTMAAQLSNQRTTTKFETTLRLAQPVTSPNNFTSTLGSRTADNAAPIGWVVVEYSQQAYLLENYQTLFVGGLIMLLALIGTSAVAVFAAQRWERAVGVLSLGIRRIERGEFKAPINLLHDSELQALAQDINRMAETVQTDAIELRRNLEQTNRDLRESLETVEVQNIELDLARREALEASRIKSEFLANTSHELRTPLTGIIGFTKLLLKGLLDSRQREYMETIRYSAENLLIIINDILDFSKIEAGKLVLDNVPFNLRDLIEETLTMLAPSATEKKLDLILLYDNDVTADLIGDPLRLRQILTNLISNGIKFTAAGHIAVRVSLAGPSAARVPLKITVSDTGIGLSESQQKHLFHAFTQADASTSREFGGTGLGLAISKRLIEQMGGEVGLSSQTGHGATFWFSVRLPAQYNPLRTREFDQLAGKQLILFDSKPLSQLALRQLLESWQVRVTPVDDWQVLLDNSPLCDGWLVSIGYQHSLLTQLPSPGVPVWVLLAGALVRVDKVSGVHLLPQPIGHVQLYDALCHELHQCAAPILLPQPRVLRTNPLQVLAVDDNPTNLKLLAIMLEELGAGATLASGGRQALGLCDRQHFDLILLDLQMPELSGTQVAQLLRQGSSENRNTRIVALTAHLLPEEREVLLAQGFDACFTKPISEYQLQQLLTDDAQQHDAAISSQPVQIQLCLQRARNKPALAKEFLAELLQNLTTTRATIQAQRSGDQRAALLEEVHRLHGACCYSGVARLQRCSYHLEQQLKEQLKEPGDDTLIDLALDELLAAIDELIEWREQYDINIVFEDYDSIELSTAP
jgi:two-component system, NarL family, sensor histidine kinase BarA